MTALAEKAAKTSELKLDLQGMTCASCAVRIEKKLNRLDGVEATVNFATEQATVHCDPSVTVEELVGAVESVGYHAHPTVPAYSAQEGRDEVAGTSTATSRSPCSRGGLRSRSC